jgi:iron complex transport system ATP-binding protein
MTGEANERMEEIITLRNVSIGYRQKAANQKTVKEDISLHALKGELVALIGENGIGKSTLLRTIAGIQPALTGIINIRSKAIDSYREKELALILSFVSTEIIRVSNLSVFDLISLGRYPYTNWSGRLTYKDRQIVEEAIEMVGLKGYENKMVNFISDGERQKTMIARTLAQDTDIVVLDEPTAFLDLSNKYEIIHILHRLANEKGKTILFSTHDLTTAIAESDRLWLMLENSVKEGSPEDLILSGSFSSLFHNDHLFFDDEKGDFRIRREVIRKVVLNGSGVELIWTRKMLERLGFEVIQERDRNLGDSLLYIDISYPFWNLRSGDSAISFESLYALSRYIKNEGSGF